MGVRASKGRRIVAFLVDATTIMLLMIVLVKFLYDSRIIHSFEIERMRLYHVSWAFLKVLCLMTLLVSILYGFIFEVLPWNATLGKLFMSIRVRTITNQKVSVVDVLARNLVKQIPFALCYLCFFFIPEVIFRVEYTSLYSFKEFGEIFGALFGMNLALIFKIIALLCLVVFFAFPFMRKNQQALHDLIVGTSVFVKEPRVKKEKTPISEPISQPIYPSGVVSATADSLVPVNVASVGSTNPVGAVPVNPVGAVPVKPAGAVPVKPAGAVPVNPVGAVPVKPAGAVPVKPAGAVPVNPVGAVPNNTVNQTPDKSQIFGQ